MAIGDPTVERDGEEITIHSDNDVLSLFERDAGFGEGDQIEELVVDTIDAEFDYHREHGDMARCYVYFKPLENLDSMAWVPTDDLEVTHWTQDSNMLGDNQLCIIYEQQL